MLPIRSCRSLRLQGLFSPDENSFPSVHLSFHSTLEQYHVSLGPLNGVSQPKRAHECGFWKGLNQGGQTHSHGGPHQPPGCLQRAEKTLGLCKCSYSLTVQELKLHLALNQGFTLNLTLAHSHCRVYFSLIIFFPSFIFWLLISLSVPRSHGGPSCFHSFESFWGPRLCPVLSLPRPNWRTHSVSLFHIRSSPRGSSERFLIHKVFFQPARLAMTFLWPSGAGSVWILAGAHTSPKELRFSRSSWSHLVRELISSVAGIL